MVSYWAPREPIAAKSEFSLAYRLSWGDGPPLPDGAVYVAATRRGAGAVSRPTPLRLFVIDFGVVGQKPPNVPIPKVNVTVSTGTVANVVVIERPDGPGWRVSFQMDPKGASLIEMRTSLVFAEPRTAETWVYRWTGD